MRKQITRRILNEIHLHLTGSYYAQRLLDRINTRNQLIDIGAPSVIIRNQRALIWRAWWGTCFPWIANWLSRLDMKRNLTNLCRTANGWSWCKRHQGHLGPCMYTWDDVAKQDLQDIEDGIFDL